MSKDTSAKIMKALAEHAFMVPAGAVYQVGGIGQSNIVNHKSTVIYAAKGPASNGKSVLANCQVRAHHVATPVAVPEQPSAWWLPLAITHAVCFRPCACRPRPSPAGSPPALFPRPSRRPLTPGRSATVSDQIRRRTAVSHIGEACADTQTRCPLCRCLPACLPCSRQGEERHLLGA